MKPHLPFIILDAPTVKRAIGKLILALALITPGTITSHARDGVSKQEPVDNAEGVIPEPTADVPVAGEPAVGEPAGLDESWSFLKLWDHTVWYENKKNPYIQKVTFIGRYHGQAYYVDSDRGTADGYETRRLRPGLVVNFLNYFKIVSEVNIEGFEDIDHFDGELVKGFDNFYVDWIPNKNLKFRVGRQKSNTSRERFTSSRFVLPFNRSRLVLQSTVDKVLGASAFYNINDKFSVQTGMFSDLVDSKFKSFDNNESIAALLKLGYKVNDNIQTYLDYWWSDSRTGSRAMRPYRHVVSLNSKSAWDGYGLITDLLYTVGMSEREGQNVFGLVLMPWFEITPKLRGVFRYQLAASNSDTGMSLQPRYEALAVTDGGGKEGRVYNAFYTGLDYRIHGEKLKVMIGTEYSNMSRGRDDFSGWTYFIGIRTWW